MVKWLACMCQSSDHLSFVLLLAITSHDMCYYVYVIMHVKDPRPFITNIEHSASETGFCLSLYILHVMNGDVYMN